MATGHWVLPYLAQIHEGAKVASYYGELLVAENDPRADEFLNGWKRQSLLMAESDDRTLIMQLVAASVARRQAPKLVDALRKHGDEKAAAELARQADEAGNLRRVDWPWIAPKSRDSDYKMVEDHGGWLNVALNRSFMVTREELRPGAACRWSRSARWRLL